MGIKDNIQINVVRQSRVLPNNRVYGLQILRLLKGSPVLNARC